MTNIRKKSYVLELNGREAAILIGCSTRQLTHKLESSDPPPRTVDAKYRTDDLGNWIRRDERRKMMGGKDGAAAHATDGPVLIPVQERARKDREMADKYELENKVRRGELLEQATVEAAAFDVVMRVRSRLLRLPASCAPLLIGAEDRVEIQQIIEKEVRDALSELSADWTGDADSE